MTKTSADKSTDPRLFATWTGHRHPIEPRGPISFEDIGNCEVFYRAKFETLQNSGKLLCFEKFRVNSKWIPLPTSDLLAGCLSVRSHGNELQPGKTIKKDEALHQKEWIFSNPDNKEGLQYIKIELVSKTHYEYSSDANVIKVVIEDKSGRHVHQA